MLTPIRSRISLPAGCARWAGILLLHLTLASIVAAAPQTMGTLILPAGTLAFTIPPMPIVSVDPCDDLDGMVLAPYDSEPIPATRVEVVLHDESDHPIADATITVEFDSDHPLCANGVLEAVTDSEGRAYLTLAGGGCTDGASLAGVIKANGVTIRAYTNVKSPDFDGAGGDLEVDLRDLITFSNAFLGRSPGCHDYDNNGVTDLADLVIFSPAFVGSNHCAP